MATAIAYGGTGAVFWMWLSAFFGQTTKFAEIALAIKYRTKDSKEYFIGGPMYHIKEGLHGPILGSIFAFCVAAYLFGGSLVQSNAISENFLHLFSIPEPITVIILLVTVGVVIIGGVKRLGNVAQVIVPFMSIFYIIGAIVVILINISELPTALASIFVQAFHPAPVVGGIGGYTLMTVLKVRSCQRFVFE